MSLQSQPGRYADIIRINELTLLLPLATGAQWPSAEGDSVLQPIDISVSILRDVRSTASTDDLTHSIDYSDTTSQIQRRLSSRPSFPSLESVVYAVYESVIVDHPGSLEGLHLKVFQHKGPLHCKQIAIESVFNFANEHWEIGSVRHVIEGLICPVIVGVGPQERLEKQDVIVSISIESEEHNLDSRHCLDTRKLVGQLYQDIYNSSYLTLEALTSFIAEQTLSHSTVTPLLPRVTVQAAKPSALVLAKSAEIVITRTLDDYPKFSNRHKPQILTPLELTANAHTVVIALGSNLGDRFRNIELALRLLETPQHLLDSEVDLENVEVKQMQVTVVDTSFLYETAPMYVTDQPSFLNCACLVETNLSPLATLRLLKKIETTVGRVPTIRNGPRAVDLDVIFYDRAVFDTRAPSKRDNLDNLQNELVIPHPRLAEREFVLRPLNDIIPDFVHPSLGKAVNALLNQLIISPDEPPMERVVPFPSSPLESSSDSALPIVPRTLTYWNYSSNSSARRKSFKTRVMATLNATPDSFSDGSTDNNMSTALAYTRGSVEAGAAIVDIGGYSTRPGAVFVTIEEEIDRVVPMVEAIRRFSSEDSTTVHSAKSIIQRVRQIPISVDTFRWEVAEASILAGANCINDVYAFSGPESYLADSEDVVERSEVTLKEMKRISRQYSVPVILMHSRSDAGQNKDYSMYQYAGNKSSVLEGVRIELGRKVDRIVKGKGGVRRWMVIADPGIGFSKTLEGNLEVLRDAAQVTADIEVGKGDERKRNPLVGYPQLIGVSRKSFLGAILGQGEAAKVTTPKERIWATAAAVTCAVQQDALVVRVHDTQEMVDVVQVADSLWR